MHEDEQAYPTQAHLPASVRAQRRLDNQSYRNASTGGFLNVTDALDNGLAAHLRIKVCVAAVYIPTSLWRRKLL